MAHYGTLRDFRFVDKDPDDVRGTTVYNVHDDKLGKIDDVIFDHASGSIRYAVVDTGGWLSSKKFIVPPDRLRESANHEGDFMTDLTKQQIEAFPPYNEKDLESEDKWNDYENRYRSKWVDGPVMHRAETDRNITPTTAQMTQGSGATGSLNWEKGSQSGTTGRQNQEMADEGMVSTDRIISPTANEVTISDSAAGIGGRWLTFESRLRQHRRDATMNCVTCSVGPASDREEDTADERKAI
jgi:hypothetical protein